MDGSELGKKLRQEEVAGAAEGLVAAAEIQLLLSQWLQKVGRFPHERFRWRCEFDGLDVAITKMGDCRARDRRIKKVDRLFEC